MMHVSIYSYTDYRKYLKDIYNQMKSQYPFYSHRYIEQRVEISRGYFSRILKGSKNISDRVIMNFIRCLKLTKNEGRFFENLVKYSQADDLSIRAMYYTRMLSLASPSVIPLIKEQFAYFTQIHHVAVRALVELVPIDDQSDFTVLGKLLLPPISGSLLQSSLQLLEKLGLIAKNDQGVYLVTNRIVATGNHPEDMVIRTYLQNSLRQTGDALTTVSAKERMASVMTITISPETYEQILELLAETRTKIHKLIEQEPCASRIYQLSMNLAPLSKQVNKDIFHDNKKRVSR